MPIVNTAVPITSESYNRYILQLVEKYPFCRTELLARTVFQRPIRTLVIGNGPRKVIYSASHHANEWITTLILLRFAEELAEAFVNDGEIYGQSAKKILETATIYMVPMVDPDGVDLVVGAIPEDSIQHRGAKLLADSFPKFPFQMAGKQTFWG